MRKMLHLFAHQFYIFTLLYKIWTCHVQQPPEKCDHPLVENVFLRSFVLRTYYGSDVLYR